MVLHRRGNVAVSVDVDEPELLTHSAYVLCCLLEPQAKLSPIAHTTVCLVAAIPLEKVQTLEYEIYAANSKIHPRPGRWFIWVLSGRSPR